MGSILQMPPSPEISYRLWAQFIGLCWAFWLWPSCDAYFAATDAWERLEGERLRAETARRAA